VSVLFLLTGFPVDQSTKPTLVDPLGPEFLHVDPEPLRPFFCKHELPMVVNALKTKLLLSWRIRGTLIADYLFDILGRRPRIFEVDRIHELSEDVEYRLDPATGSTELLDSLLIASML
jgi:hypothetical protein